MTTVATQSLSASMENYLETILLLIREHTVARSKDISDRLNVKRSSVTGALQSLRERGLVNHERYGFVTLTDEGSQIAKRVLRRHEALRTFFVNVLAIDGTEADEAACRMEHGISKLIADRLVDFADFMENCPKMGVTWVHGAGYRCAEAAQSIEQCERCIAKSLQEAKAKILKGEPATMSITTLNELKPGEKGHIEKVAGNQAIKRRIRDMGVTNGSLVEVVRIAPMGDPIDVKIKGYHLSLRKKEAADISVKRV